MAGTTSEKKHPLGKILVALKYATVDQVKEALTFQKEHPDVRLGRAMQQLGFCSDVQIAKALAKQQGVPFLDLGDASKISPDVLALAKPEIVKEHAIVPVLRKGVALTVAASGPMEYFTLDNLRFIFGCEVSYCIAPERQLAEAIRTVYGITDVVEQLYSTKAAQSVSFDKLDDAQKIDAADDDGIVAQLVQAFISDGIKRRASDIHIEPMTDRVRIRYRIDGNCIEMESPPKRLQGPLISRVKILAGLDITEKRLPQDGRIKTKVEGRDIDLRVSSLPCFFGESVVMRILDKAKNLASLETLGMHSSDFERFNRILNKPNGVFLVTGPTGSGKTTTLYAALQSLNRPDIKLITAEDPVEYNMTGINQCQVKEDIGLTFARVLRAMLRQAPNVILVGEIRDEETAGVAVEAALTGHLVFSTLHTNDAPSSLTRLINIGVKPFLAATAVQGILAQRLVRRLCPHCKREYTPSEADLKTIGLKPEQVKGKSFYAPVGCDKCSNTGYRGRMAVFELLDMGLAMRELVFQNADDMRLRHAAIENGMSTLQVDGVRKVLAGLTTVEEVLTITHRDDM